MKLIFLIHRIYAIGVVTFGEALKELKIQREKIIISIKIFKSGFDANDRRENRKNIIEEVKN